MRTNILRSFAVAIGLSTCSIGQAQYTSPASAYTSPAPYSSPAKWNNFNVPKNVFLTAADNHAAQQADDVAAELPAPKPQVDATADAPAKMVGSAIGSAEVAADDGSCNSCYSTAAAAPWSGRPQLARYFGGASLLFLTMENKGYRNLINNDATGAVLFTTADVDPSGSTGFEVFGGRYINCNRHALSFGYMLWNPGEQEILSIPGVAGAYRAPFPAFNDISVDPGTGVDTIYNHFDGAAGYRVRRDLRFQGIEANLSSFGIGGAGRVASCNPRSILGSRFGAGIGLGKHSCRGYGGMGGPLTRGACGRLQLVTSHGFRWFQVRDAFELAGNIDGTVGYQANDIYYNVDTRNNLFGYQFGGRLIYVLGCRWNLSVGGKFGLYGNRAEYRQRIGTLGTLAYRNATPTDFILTEDKDTVLSTLGELDLGVGFRLSAAWTIRGGYRLMGVTGLATATDQFAPEYGSSLLPSTYLSANDSIVLHGGYLGAEYNW